jgi:hypothetical protein
MKMTPTAAMVLLLGFLPLHVITEAEAPGGTYILTCNQEWRPKSTNHTHTERSQDIDHKPILLLRTDEMIPRYKYHKPFKVQLLNKHEWQNVFNPRKKGGLVWYTDRSKTNKGTGARVYKWGSKKGHSFSLGLHTMVFQAEIYAIKAHIMENTEKGYRGKNIYILSDNQAIIKALNNFQINS